MKKIGFVDFYISEWHANNYPAWIENANKALGTDYKVAYCFAEQFVSPVDGRNTDEWCKDFGVEKCQTLEELCEKSDVILVLSPSNPEKHLGFAEVVLKYGKPTYIDKTFAPNIEDAKQIFAIADKYNTPFFSTSALRYATELEGMANPTEVIVAGGGSTVDEYIVHQLEMLVKKLGLGATTVKAEKVGQEYSFFIGYDDGRAGMLNFGDYPFYCFFRNEDKTFKTTVGSDFFGELIKDIIKFYENAKPSFDGAETLEVIAIRDAVLQAKNNLGEVVKVVK